MTAVQRLRHQWSEHQRLWLCHYHHDDDHGKIDGDNGDDDCDDCDYGDDDWDQVGTLRVVKRSKPKANKAPTDRRVFPLGTASWDIGS
jgi:hypothetical protein